MDSPKTKEPADGLLITGLITGSKLNNRFKTLGPAKSLSGLITHTQIQAEPKPVIRQQLDWRRINA